MIRIKYMPEKGQLWIRGHSGYAEPGKDIVCAGISALFETLGEHPSVCRGHGCAKENEHVLLPRTGTEKEMMPMFDLIASGMRAIAEKYPDNVSFQCAE